MAFPMLPIGGAGTAENPYLFDLLEILGRKPESEKLASKVRPGSASRPKTDEPSQKKAGKGTAKEPGDLVESSGLGDALTGLLPIIGATLFGGVATGAKPAQWVPALGAGLGTYAQGLAESRAAKQKAAQVEKEQAFDMAATLYKSGAITPESLLQIAETGSLEDLSLAEPGPPQFRPQDIARMYSKLPREAQERVLHQYGLLPPGSTMPEDPIYRNSFLQSIMKNPDPWVSAETIDAARRAGEGTGSWEDAMAAYDADQSREAKRRERRGRGEGADKPWSPQAIRLFNIQSGEIVDEAYQREQWGRVTYPEDWQRKTIALSENDRYADFVRGMTGIVKELIYSDDPGKEKIGQDWLDQTFREMQKRTPTESAVQAERKQPEPQDSYAAIAAEIRAMGAGFSAETIRQALLSRGFDTEDPRWQQIEDALSAGGK